MFSIRRYVIYLALAAAIVLIYNQISAPQPKLRDPTTLRESTHAAVPVAKQETAGASQAKSTPFRWDTLPEIYPIPSESLIPLPTGQPRRLPAIQHKFGTETASDASTRKSRLTAVRNAFKRCWDAYRQKAWMHDELSPISGSYNDKFGGWAATLIDNLDTLWIMGFRKEFMDAAKAVMTIDTTDIKIDSVNVFETTIRHLGGCLSAYDLSGEESLLVKAKEFGEMLIKPFDTPNHLPNTRWDWKAAAKGQPQEGPEEILLAEIGSLSMEFTHLSQLTGDIKWYSAVQNISLLFEKELENSALPGVFPITIHAKHELDVTQDNWFSLNSMADSFYEYLPKMYLLLGGLEPLYQKLYTATMATATEHLIYRPLTPDNADILFSGAVRIKGTDAEFSPQVQHLGCFTGGMFALGGKLFNDADHFDIGRKLTDGCVWAYKSMPLGIMAELFFMVRCEDQACEWNEKLWHASIKNRISKEADVTEHIRLNRLRNGITEYEDKKYQLRPEAIESVFLLYRMTGDATLQDTAWDMFTAIMNMTTTDIANAAIQDITYTHVQLKNDQGRRRLQEDSMESFWMAETLKYFYLMFSEPDVISLDEFVFNTEAHPFRRPASSAINNIHS